MHTDKWTRINEQTDRKTDLHLADRQSETSGWMMNRQMDEETERYINRQTEV
jgi:hypothetical protein